MQEVLENLDIIKSTLQDLNRDIMTKMRSGEEINMAISLINDTYTKVQDLMCAEGVNDQIDIIADLLKPIEDDLDASS